MQGEAREKWQKLCQQAAVETDHERLLQLVQEISALLEAKEKRLADKLPQSVA